MQTHTIHTNASAIQVSTVKYLSMQTQADKYLPIHTIHIIAYQYIQIETSTYQYRSVLSNTYQYRHKQTNTYQYIQYISLLTNTYNDTNTDQYIPIHTIYPIQIKTD